MKPVAALPSIRNFQELETKAILESRPAYLKDIILAVGQAHYMGGWKLPQVFAATKLAERAGYRPRSAEFWGDVVRLAQRSNPENHNSVLEPLCHFVLIKGVELLVVLTNGHSWPMAIPESSGKITLPEINLDPR